MKSIKSSLKSLLHYVCGLLSVLCVMCLLCAASLSFCSVAEASPVLRQINISFDEPFDAKKVREQLVRHCGQEVTAEILQSVLDEVNDYFRANGYPTSKAYFPEQISDDGSITVAVVNPYLEDIEFKNISHVKIETRRKLMQDVMKQIDHSINSDEMDSALLKLQDLYAFRVFGRYVRAQSGNDHMILKLSMRPMQHQYPFTAYFDNHGSKASGEYRLGVAGSVKNISGHADNLSYYFQGTNEKMLNGGLAYRIPLNSHPTVLGLGLNAGSYELSDEYEKLGAKGYSYGIEAYLEEPVLRTRSYGLKTRFGGHLRELEDRFDTFDIRFKKRQSSGFLECSGFYKYKGFMFQGSTAVTMGRTTNLDDYDSSPEGAFTLLNADASLSYRIIPGTVARLDTSVQKASRPLDGALRFSAGGADKISAFTSSEGCADEGMFGSVMLTHKLNDSFTIKPHLDGARIANKNGKSAFIKGAGLKLGFSSDGFFANLDAATAIGKIHGRDKAKVLFQVGYMLS